MARITQNVFNNFKRILTIQRNINAPKICYSSNQGENANTSEEMLSVILKKRFPEAKQIEVKDVSGGCGAMYEIYVETVEFKGLNIVKQHRSITDTLKEQIKLIHGLRISTKIPPS